MTASLLTHDALPLDDTAYASFAPARNLQVLVVGSQPRFIQQAFASLPGVTVRIQDAPSDDGPRADVVVYAGVQPPLLSKGNFILFDSVPPNLPLRVNGVLRVPAITGWNRSDPLLDSVSLAGIAIGQALDLDPGPGFTVLAASGRSPLLLSWDHSGVRALMLAFDPRSSDFPLRPAFPILLANALSWFFPDWLEPQADEVQAGDPRLISTGGAGVVTVLKPDGRRVDLAANGPSVTFSDTDETGFYKVDAGGESSEFAVNLSSDSETDISQRFTVPSSRTEVGERARVPVPVWPAVAAAALALLLLEWLVWLRRPGRSLTT